MLKLALLVFTIGVSVGAVAAAPITYDITFAFPGTDVAKTVGSFTYDASLPSDNFTNFNISSFSGLNYDLTSSANNPIVSGVCTVASAQASFLFLTTSNCGSPLYGGNQWVEDVFGSGKSLDLYGTDVSGSIAIIIDATMYGDYGAGFENGIFSVAPATPPAPEPSTIALSIAGLSSMLAYVIRRQKVR
jgi:hypothetical protein